MTHSAAQEASQWTARGVALAGENRLREAAECFRQAIALEPAQWVAHKNLGICLEVLGDLPAAAEAFRGLIGLPEMALEAHRKLGDLAVMSGDMATAAAHYQQAATLSPADARLHQNLGSALSILGRYDDAIVHFRHAISVNPECADFHRGLGLSLMKVCRYDEAEQCLHSAVELQPAGARGHANLGQVLQCAGQTDAALASFQRAIELNPRDAEARLGRATCWLLQGNFAYGWPEYEWRSELGYLRAQHDAPRWNGESLDGRTLLIETEQGLGDTIQFVRYAAEIKKQHATKILLACESRLMPLLTSASEIDQLVPQDGPRPPFNCWTPLMSLPGLLRHDVATFPRHTPYLSAESSRVELWKSRLSALPGRRIGIAWQGNPTFPQDRERSIPLTLFLHLAEQPNFTLVSLQKGPGSDHLDAEQNKTVVSLGDQMDTDGAFLDTAAVMVNLDLVITSDTSIAHLAGALGAPVWVALPLVPHWRWGLTGETSPWYPTMRLFRQSRRGDWPEVFDRIAAALAQL